MMQRALLSCGLLFSGMLLAARFSPAQSAVTISVTVPVTANEGENIAEVAARFAARNGLGQGAADQIASALVAQYEAQIFESRRLARCIKWQRAHGVVPLQSWGTLPENERPAWLELECDSVVPKTPEEPFASVPIKTDVETLNLDFFRGDDLDQTVIDFCRANNVSVETHGAALKEALLNAVKEALPKEEAKTDTARRLLFTVPVNVGDQRLGLEVHEGDNLVPLIKNFCQTYGIDEATYGQPLADAVMKNLEDLERQLSQDAQQQDQQNPAGGASAAPKEGEVLFQIPMTVNGEQTAIVVREGARLNSVVSEFCATHNVDEAQYADTLRKTIIDGFNKFNALKQNETN